MITPKSRVQRVFVLLACLLGGPLNGQETESPFTVAPGKLLVEMDGLKLSFNRAEAAGNTYTAIAVASTIVTAGIAHGFDFQVGADLFLRQNVDVGGRRDSRSGLGDLYFRAKWTVWQDEKTGAAVAVLPYVKVPANTGGVGNGSVEGGLMVPWAMRLQEGLTAGAMFRWDVVRNDADTGYDAHWHLTGFAQHDFTRLFALYTEATFMAQSTGFSEWRGSLGIGALLTLTARLQLDYELQRGLNRRATDWTHVFRVNWEW